MRVPHVPQCSVALEHGKLLIYKEKSVFLSILFHVPYIYITTRGAVSLLTVLTSWPCLVRSDFGEVVKTTGTRNMLTTKRLTS